MASSDVASNPRVPKEARAASRTLPLVSVRVSLAGTYQMVEKRAVIREQLSGKTIAVTGTTGFLGTAQLERLLRGVPDAHLVLLLRPGRRSTVQQRANREIFKNDAFDVLRAQVGGNAEFDAMIADRV